VLYAASSSMPLGMANDKSVGWPAWAQVVERGSEGYIVKDEVSAYEGGPTRRWLKIKQKGWTVEEDRWRRRISESPPTR
jgi:ATP-dependent DNA ligase